MADQNDKPSGQPLPPSDSSAGGATSDTRLTGKAAHAASPSHHQKLVGLVSGSVIFAALVLVGPPEGMSAPAWHTLAVAALMAFWWATEAVPLAATALVPLVAFPLLGVQPVRPTAASYGHPLIFLFMGGFFVAQAMQRWNLHRRIALSIAVRAGADPGRLIAGFMVATAFLSMWVSNTATTIMMLPIAASVISVVILNSPHAGADSTRNFGLAAMLAIAYSASVGGMATLIGTPPNALFAAFFEQQYSIEISFAGWMLLALPLVLILLPAIWLLLTRVIYPFDLGRTSTDAAHGQEEVRAQLSAMGTISVPEIRVALIFAAMAILWLTRPLLDDVAWLSGLSDPGIAIGGAILLFLMPSGLREAQEPASEDAPNGVDTFSQGSRLLEWAQARQISWDVLILFGGGLALAGAFTSTGLAASLGQSLSGVSQAGTGIALGAAYLSAVLGIDLAVEAWLPLLIFVVLIAAMVIFLTELTSNTATVAALLPVIASIADASGYAPMVLAVAAVFAASCAFMLPVATPPNAIVFASGYVTVPQMMRAGFFLNLLGIALIAVVATFLAPVIFG